MTDAKTQTLFVRLTKIKKRDGRIVDFDSSKITQAIFKAAQSVGGKDRELATALALEVALQLQEKVGKEIPTVTQVQDLVEKTLIENGHVQTSKAYILSRYKKEEEHRRKALILGGNNTQENLAFSNEALAILGRRYLRKDELGNLIETPQSMLQRVARNVASADLSYGTSAPEVEKTEQKFYEIMADLRFLPNSPTLMNAESKSQQLSSCFVLPVEDTMEGIFGTLRDAAIIHQRGSGTGFSFSRLRPKGDTVGQHRGVASGAVSFLTVYDSALETVKQGGIRSGANMAVLRVDHPDILRFIESKRDKKALKNFNISVAITDKFMKAVEEDKYYYLVNPHTNKYLGKLRAKDVFSVIIQNAWKTGDPGLLFIDEINRKHPARHLGDIETTNQCGEAPLLPYEGCILGSLNLMMFLKNDDGEGVDWDSLRETIYTAVHFLDNIIDKNSYPTPAIEEATKRTRKFGLGIMGLADLLCALKIRYDSKEGLEMADKIMAFVKTEAYEKSKLLAEQRGVFPAWEGSDHEKAERKMRNATCISISPTGTISILAGVSHSCEPLFAISYNQMVLGDTEIVYLNKAFEKIAKERGFYSPELIRNIARIGSIQDFKEIPKDVREIFVTAQDISPDGHIKMQSTLQKHVDNSISKTINLPASATIKDVEEAYMLAWKAKCKGITVYRDGSYEDQILNVGLE